MTNLQNQINSTVEISQSCCNFYLHIQALLLREFAKFQQKYKTVSKRKFHGLFRDFKLFSLLKFDIMDDKELISTN